MGEDISHYRDLEKLGGGEAVAYLRGPWPDTAAATPSEISMPPERKRWRRDQLGLPRRRSATVPANNPQRLSLTTPLAAKSKPRKRICAATGPRDGLTN